LQLSAGFSSIESFILQASIQQSNFRGRGQTVGASVSYSRYSRSAQLSFTEPYVFDRNISAGIDIYRRDYNNRNFNTNDTTYKQTTTGIQLRAGLPLTEYMSAIGSYTLNVDDVTLGQQYYSDRQNPPLFECDPLLSNRSLCEALGKRTSSILGLTLVYDSLDSRVRPSRGTSVSYNLEFAGLGGSVKYAKFRANAAQYFPLGKGFIFSLHGEGGIIESWGNDDVRLTDRFFLGEPQIRGFDIRGVGPRIQRKFYQDVNADGVTGPDEFAPDQQNLQDDALGGRYYYLTRAELEIPLGSGARELGLRPSIFVDAGAVFGLRRPLLTDTGPGGVFIPQRDASGLPVYTQIDTTAINATSGVCEITATSVVTSATNTNTFVCIPTNLTPSNNTAIGSSIAFRELYLGNSPRPRISIGIGVNWNSPFGPFRIDFAKTLLKVDGDDTKSFTFNVGTQF
jgi:outer membrane protein insertion porin family